jgi:S1-C subfamily serine protease
MAFATGKGLGLPRLTGNKPYLGVTLNTLDGGKGCVVDDVMADNPAHAAGVRKGDQITGWNDQPIACPDDVFTQMDAAKPGQKVTLIILRDGKKQSLTVTLGSR